MTCPGQTASNQWNRDSNPSASKPKARDVCKVWTTELFGLGNALGSSRPGTRQVERREVEEGWM